VSAAAFLATGLSIYAQIKDETNAVLEFGHDIHREKFIYVDEMKTTEAKELLKRLKVKFSNDEMQYVFTSPAMLQ
jgi:hypothetical protein